MRLVRKERSGYRDLAWNLRQRCYGFDVPFLDIDALAYDNKKSLALFEDKHEAAALARPSREANIKAAKDLAFRAGVPLFGRRIAADFSWIIVRNLNPMARQFTPKQLNPSRDFGERLTEAEHLQWRYWLGGRQISVSQAQEIINDGLRHGLNKPECRSLILRDLDDHKTTDIDIASLDAIDLIKLQSAINRRLGIK